MKQLSSEFENHIKSGVTTLATCWVLKRSDGVTFGFTDHDRPIPLSGTLCEPSTGMTGSEIRQSGGFASDDQEIGGILSSDTITEADLVSGRYDAATIETWRVNWQNADQAVLLRSAYIGEIRRDGQSFQVELRSLSIELEQERGRVYQYGCDTTLGDKSCGVNLKQPHLSFDGEISAILSATEIQVAFASQPEAGGLTIGNLQVVSGKADGMEMDILTHQVSGDEAVLELWLPIHTDIVVGDRVKASVGCDKQFGTCKNRFGNQLNFQGFPSIPGNDFILSYPEQNQVRDGSAMVEE